MYSRNKKAIILAILITIIPTASFAKSFNKQESEKICLAKAIYYEAKGEPESGKRAVAKVVLNRKKHEKFPKSICGVINQINYDDGKKLCQFSWVCVRPKKFEPESWKTSLILSDDILNNKVVLPNFNPDVLFFKSTSSKKSFGKGYKLITRVGHSNFYEKKSI